VPRRQRYIHDSGLCLQWRSLLPGVHPTSTPQVLAPQEWFWRLVLPFEILLPPSQRPIHEQCSYTESLLSLRASPSPAQLPSARLPSVQWLFSSSGSRRTCGMLIWIWPLLSRQSRGNAASCRCGESALFSISSDCPALVPSLLYTAFPAPIGPRAISVAARASGSVTSTIPPRLPSGVNPEASLCDRCALTPKHLHPSPPITRQYPLRAN
jgi:hypothetical protein